MTMAAGVARALALAGLLVGGCMPVLGPERAGRPGPLGPQIHVDVANRLDRDVTIGYAFEDVASAGGGEGMVPACSRSSIGFGEVGGSYEVRVDGATVFEGNVPEGTPPDGFLVVRLTIDADGTADLKAPPGWSRIPPEMDDARLEDCE